MAFCNPQQLSQCLPRVVPKLTEVCNACSFQLLRNWYPYFWFPLTNLGLFTSWERISFRRLFDIIWFHDIKLYRFWRIHIQKFSQLGSWHFSRLDWYNRTYSIFRRLYWLESSQQLFLGWKRHKEPRDILSCPHSSIGLNRSEWVHTTFSRHPSSSKDSIFLLWLYFSSFAFFFSLSLLLFQTTFVNSVDAPSLALLVPIVHRGLRERSSETKKKASQIVGNMCSLVTEPKDMIPYIGLLLPEVKKVIFRSYQNNEFSLTYVFIFVWTLELSGSCGSNSRGTFCGSKGCRVTYQRNGRGQFPRSCSMAIRDSKIWYKQCWKIWSCSGFKWGM